jgi:DNA-binding transcriptional LysR family regulator
MSTPASPTSLLQLLCFVHVVEAGSFAEAGRRLGITTSAVSKTIARFESTHGLKLLHRSTHSQSLTAEGETLLTEARDTLRSVERLEAALTATAQGGAKGRVRISAPTAFVRACLVPLLPTFLANHPDIGVDLRGSDATDDLALQGIDVAIRAGALDGIPGHIALPLLRFSWVACATPDFLKRHGTPETPAGLCGRGLIGFRNSATGRVQAWRFRPPRPGEEAIRVVPDGRVLADDAMSAWEMARLGQGIAWGPYWLAADELRAGRVVEIFRDWRDGATPMSVLRRERHVPSRTEAVIKFLRKSAALWSEPDSLPEQTGQQEDFAPKRVARKAAT